LPAAALNGRPHRALAKTPISIYIPSHITGHIP
jgi:hypothetical protein